MDWPKPSANDIAGMYPDDPVDQAHYKHFLATRHDRFPLGWYDPPSGVANNGGVLPPTKWSDDEFVGQAPEAVQLGTEDEQPLEQPSERDASASNTARARAKQAKLVSYSQRPSFVAQRQAASSGARPSAPPSADEAIVDPIIPFFENIQTKPKSAPRRSVLVKDPKDEETDGSLYVSPHTSDVDYEGQV